ncbi:hypothetical protein GCM10011581_26750 [Saccharopolyspora subtropica]|uniref:DUF3040 domain-containing protein n=1 Tax=Saccharopolyspora thermophila TaxID=89367 RepID=A0A917ND00_9PSEU|nr:DUF3040 domain-containing protein [Saccharopolyspora subtropica]GGI88268.1 hypothetical protein GCM10011581_26750 [Saccharopolyspora subtropica]
MLSRHERNRLAEIESALVSDDPRLAEKFDRFGSGPSWPGIRRLLVFAVLVVTALLALMCLVSGLVVSSVVLAVLTAGGAVATWWHARHEHRT